MKLSLSDPGRELQRQVFRSLILFSCIAAFLAPTAVAQTKQQNSRAESSESGRLNSIDDTAREMLELTGILPMYFDLQDEQKRQPSKNITDKLELIQARQNVIYLHQKITQSYQTADAELRSAIAKLDFEASSMTDLRAAGSSQRSKIQHRASVTNLVSGGATKIGGYTAALAHADPLPTNALEVFDGVVQMGLSGLILRQEHSEENEGLVIPEAISTFLNSGEAHPKNYPASVWTYLNHPVPGRADGKSRRRLVVDTWLKQRRVVENGGRSEAPKSAPTFRMVMTKDNNIDVTLAMMQDIRATLSGMESSLASISELLRQTYSNDNF
jgi:hypothetical protein